jgi:hypothetical protein
MVGGGPAIGRVYSPGVQPGNGRLGSRTNSDSADKQRAAIWLARLVALASVLGLVSAAVAKPKQIEPPKLSSPPMRVVIIRDSRAGCEPNCAEWISAQGEITKDTPAQFRRLFKTLGAKRLPIFITSPGGAVAPAMAIGHEIRQRGLDVAVERTIFQMCEAPAPTCDLAKLKDGDKGRPEPIAASCSSACVLILAAGKERLVPVYGFVGVHQHHEWQTMRQTLQTYRIQRSIENWRVVEHREVIAEKELSRTKIEREPNYGPVRTYYTAMGIDTAALMPLLLGTPHTGIHRMTPEERRTTRIVTRFAPGDELLQTASLAADAKPDAPSAAGGQAAAAAPKLTTEVTPVYPPSGEAIELFIRVKAADPPSPAAHFAADITFAGGKKLIAASTGERPADPLYAALATEDFCVLRRVGNLAMRISIRDAARPERPVQIAADLAGDPRSAQFAGLHCTTAAVMLPVTSSGLPARPWPAKN